MGSELVSTSFPDNNETEGGEGQHNGSDAAHRSYTDIFNQCLPFYLYIGMTYDQFWHDDVEIVKYYREAHKLRQQHENSMAWWQGRYVYDAICAASPLIKFTMGKQRVEAMPYVDKPYPITQKEAEERQRKEAYEREMEMRERIRADILAKKAEFQRNKEVSENNAE